MARQLTAATTPTASTEGRCEMAIVTGSVEVAAPLSAVYNQWTQFTSFPRSMSGVEQVTQIDDTHTHWVISLGGVTREFDATIVVQHPDQRLAWSSTDGTTHSGVVSFETLDDTHTRVTVEMNWQPAGLIEKIGKGLGFDGRQVGADLVRFKSFIENRGSETGAWRGEVPAR